MNPKLIYIFIALLAFLLVIRVAVYFFTVENYSEGKNISFEARISGNPDLSGRGQRVSLIMPNNQRISTLFSHMPIISYGDVVRVEGRVEYFVADNGNKVAIMNFPKFEIIEKGQNSLQYIIREKIISIFESSLGPKESALILGITFGIKREMSEDFNLDLQKTGLMHVIAASGMNITMVGGFMLGLFSVLVRRQIALVFSIISILLYALLAGMEASIVRASIMGIIVFSAQVLGRQSIAFVSLFFAAFIMLFISPSLLGDVGFQLSFLATAGLVYLRPVFIASNRIKTLINKSVVGEDLVTTLTAQISTLPILLLNFGSFSVVSILVNTLVLWTVPIIMIVGGISALIGLLMPQLGGLISYVSIPFLYFFIKVIEFFGEFGGSISIKSLPTLIIAGYYLILFSIIIYLNKHK